MEDANLDHFLKVAQDAVRTAGEQVRKLRPQAQIRMRKEDGDLVTDGDLAAENHILSLLEHEFPRHGYCSEERGESHVNAEYVWTLDPIDGSKYYAGNVPLYALSLALRHHGEFVLGVVYAPESGQMFSAAAGRGSALNGRRITCSSVNAMEHATLCLEIPNRGASRADRQSALPRLGALLDQAFRVRIIGVSALGLCLTASGGFDAYVNLGGPPDPVDYAAGWVVAREAGAEVRLIGRHLLAGPPELCRKIRDIIEI